MHLQSLHIEQFRSYQGITIDFTGGNVHVLIGPNGAGKTNILEAISVLSLTKSCQKADDTDLVSWGNGYYRVRAMAVTDEGEEKQLELVSQFSPRKEKACFVNDVRLAVSDMVGILPTVVFLPQDLELFTGAPSLRRQFIDQLLCQVSPEYLHTLSTYQKILRQRNALLKRIRDGIVASDDLAVWDEKVAETGTVITLRRLELIEVLQCSLGEELLSLGEDWSDAVFHYQRKGQARTFAEARQELLDMLATNHERDIVTQSTSVGPHRDDWSILVDNRSIATFASRGQQRTAVLALLFLEVSYVELQRGERPVILLDDVFSELDDQHQSALLKSLAEHQVIITTTHIPSTTHNAKVWYVEQGELVQA